MSPQLQEAFGYLTEATNFGSLIPVPAEVQGEIEDLLAQLDARGDADLFADQAMGQVRSGLRQLGYLARRYHCVVTNPPYAGTAGLNPSLLGLASKRYKTKRSDLYAFFIHHLTGIAKTSGFVGMITRNDWLFTKSYEDVRKRVLQQKLLSVLDLGPDAFPFTSGEVVQAAAFVLQIGTSSSAPAVFFGLRDGDSKDKQVCFLENKAQDSGIRRTPSSFRAFPFSAFVYDVSNTVAEIFARSSRIESKWTVREGIHTGDNERFIRYWWEVDWHSICPQAKSIEDFDSSRGRWAPYNKGGTSSKWYGENLYVIAFDTESRKKMAELKGHVRPSQSLYFQPGLTWGDVGRIGITVKYYPAGFLFDGAGPVVVGPQIECVAAILNSVVLRRMAEAVMPNLHFKSGTVRLLPIPQVTDCESLRMSAKKCINLSKSDWNSNELSWEFRKAPLLVVHKDTTKEGDWDQSENELSRSEGHLESLHSSLVRRATGIFEEIRSLELENNRILISRYGLESEFSPDVSVSEVTVFSGLVDGERLEEGVFSIDRSKTIARLVSYGVGCIFGRYSLDKEGLILANAGDDLGMYLAHIPEPALRPDDSGILPITDDNDFADDLPSQWRAFLRAAFGDEHYEENLRFVEDGLGKRLRPYFLKGFYDDHVKRYKKRPIYWLITSPEGSLQALIYLHRYNRDTVNRFLNDYLRPYQQKLEAKRVSAEHVLIGGGSSQSEKTKAQKRIDEIRKVGGEAD